MASAATRRPLPALAFLLALIVLTSIVWWRVMHRSTGAAAVAPTCTPAAPVTLVPRPVHVAVRVLNATNHAHLARRIADALAKDGFKISAVDNDQKQITGVGEIRYASSARASATLLSFYIPGATLVVRERTAADVELSLGSKFPGTIATAAQVSAAMKSAHVTLETVKPHGLPATPTPKSPSARAASATASALPTC